MIENIEINIPVTDNEIDIHVQNDYVEKIIAIEEIYEIISQYKSSLKRNYG